MLAFLQQAAGRRKVASQRLSGILLVNARFVTNSSLAFQIDEGQHMALSRTFLRKVVRHITAVCHWQMWLHLATHGACMHVMIAVSELHRVPAGAITVGRYFVIIRQHFAAA